MIYVDHNSVALFEQIPEQYLTAAENLHMFYMDRSVGGNISSGLDCLSYPSDEDAPNSCSIYIHPVPEFSVDPSEVDWSRPGGYSRDNWVYEFWPVGCGFWREQIGCFMDRATAVTDQYEVLSFQFSYLEVIETSTIADPTNGFFVDSPTQYDIYDLVAFEAQHPDDTFIYWTTSLARSIGTEVSESFNQQMREFAIENEVIFFDVADIESHDPDGNPCYDNRDGVPYNNGPGQSENHPDDGLNLEAICQHYTTEAENGHLGNVSAGMIRVAKAYWVLMAQIAGWDPN